MCGLVAIISKNKSGFMYKDKTIFLQMLISDMFRGMDSTGCFAVNKHGNLNMIKDTSAATFFINKKEGSKFFDGFVNDYHIVVGHNRKATMGGIVAENAHPFIEGNICLVHNGTLQNHYKLANKVVDSNAVAAHINEKGYKSLLRNIEGAYALIWYNAEEKTLYFCRNSERPLHYVETSDKIYIASEAKMLDWILDRNDLAKYTIQNVPTDKVFKFNLDSRKIECESKPKKEQVSRNRHQQNQSHNQSEILQAMGCGHLALAYSSAKTSTPSTNNKKVATINTYKSGQTVLWRIKDFDYTDKSCKLVGDTADGYETACNIWLPLTQYSSATIDKLISADVVSGRISSITSKYGFVSIYLSSVLADEMWVGKGGVQFSANKFHEVGCSCFSCQDFAATKEEAKEWDITVNVNGDLLYVLCPNCSDESHIYKGGYC